MNFNYRYDYYYDIVLAITAQGGVKMVNVTTESKRLQSRKVKNIIYVDASSLKGRYKIGLLDKGNKRKDTLLLGKDVPQVHIAEQYAILYGLMYIQKRGEGDRYILMNDCESATQDKELLELAARLNTKLLWIPREINKADKVARQKPNKKRKVWHRLHFFMSILSPFNVIEKDNQPSEENNKTLSPIVKIIYQKLLEISDNFPMTTSDFSQVITTVYNQENIGMKKGASIRARKELCNNNIIHIENKIVTLIT